MRELTSVVLPTSLPMPAVTAPAVPAAADAVVVAWVIAPNVTGIAGWAEVEVTAVAPAAGVAVDAAMEIAPLVTVIAPVVEAATTGAVSVAGADAPPVGRNNLNAREVGIA